MIFVLVFIKNLAHSNYAVPLSNGSNGYHRPKQPVYSFYINPITALFLVVHCLSSRIVIVVYSRFNRITPTYSATPR